jgi:hypothetical protein
MRAIALALTLCLFSSQLIARPLSLHPANPHYFLFRDEPTVLITSAEHYGAVLNADFDYVRYLDTLAADGLNLTRIFSGAYVEPAGAFNIAKNTLAPAPDRFLAPWLRSRAPGNVSAGYAGGGDKFDLLEWNPAYFIRLRDFVSKASERGIIVEVTFFCPMYEDTQWALSPMNSANNVNGIGSAGKHEVYDLAKNGDLQRIQEALVRKIVAELADADNVYYEICNEPYFGGVTMEWQHRIADVITEAETRLPVKHLISQNVANGSEKIEQPHPAISIFNFHYAHPPDAVAQNYALGKAIGDNETGFKGTADDHYRMEAWEFLLAGGALFNHLDYSFAVGHEDGTFAYPPTQPGGGNAGFRKQIGVLAAFMKSFDFLRMEPARDLIKSGVPEKGRAQLLAEPSRQYAAYLKDAGAAVRIEVRAGSYRVECLDAITGEKLRSGVLRHPGGEMEVALPPTVREVALRIVSE